MKQLPMTPELSQLIQSAVGEDVETENLAVFEAIALNTKPLPYKVGSIFEQARVAPVTLHQMVSAIADGKHVPLMSDHQMLDEPKGRVFAAGLDYASDGGLEMRVLFYVDATERTTITKLNAASIDEVSVQFLSTQLLCSECGWDYFGPERSSEALYSRTCLNGHTVGTDGVHVQLVGLDTFLEVSLVARGAADTPKILGKSASKLTPATKMRLAASGIEIEGLVCRGTQGEDPVTSPIDFTKLTSDLVAAQVGVATLTAEKGSLEASIATLSADKTSLEATVADLTTKLSAAEAAPTNEADYQVALSFLSDLHSNLATAAGKSGEAPKTVEELKAGILGMTNDLTAILPVGGVAAGAETDAAATVVASAFSTRKLGS
jgi:hypothetical protein